MVGIRPDHGVSQTVRSSPLDPAQAEVELVRAVCEPDAGRETVVVGRASSRTVVAVVSKPG